MQFRVRDSWVLAFGRDPFQAGTRAQPRLVRSHSRRLWNRFL